MTGLGVAALLLADGRFPDGGHAHSGGLEAAVACGAVTDLADLQAYVAGRLSTIGLTDAALAAWTVAAGVAGRLDAAVLAQVNAEAGARIAAPALRATSQQQARLLLRVAAVTWPSALTDTIAATVCYYPVAIGVTGVAAGLSPIQSAQCCAYLTVTAATSAAVRLLGLDPVAVAALVARCAPDIDRIADAAGRGVHGSLRELPAWSAPLSDIRAEAHRRWEVRLFAS